LPPDLPWARKHGSFSFYERLTRIPDEFSVTVVLLVVPWERDWLQHWHRESHLSQQKEHGQIRADQILKGILSGSQTGESHAQITTGAQIPQYSDIECVSVDELGDANVVIEGTKVPNLISLTMPAIRESMAGSSLLHSCTVA
jgi:hypothetical protein